MTDAARYAALIIENRKRRIEHMKRLVLFVKATTRQAEDQVPRLGAP